MMIIALITMLAATCVTGWMMTTEAYWGADRTPRAWRSRRQLPASPRTW
jgi:cytochrome b